MNVVEEFIAHISEKPWGSITEADYSIEQWHRACLIHLHTGAPTSKAECKLPVKTPSGVLNRNGVHAAAAALHGARAPLKAPPDQKASAALALIRAYHQLNEEPPPSLKHSEEFINELGHHGVKGMHWGVRKGKGKVTRGTQRTTFGKSPKNLTDSELHRRIQRMEAERKYNSLNKRDIHPAERFITDILHNAGKKTVQTVANNALLMGTEKALEQKFGKSTAKKLTAKGKK